MASASPSSSCRAPSSGSSAATHPDGTYDGNGLGLAIARSLARAHGGDAVAMNQPGGGALVRLELPMTAPEPSAADLS